jgi:ubiquinone/menaquinone biosynthesis C-methylase UbiE
MTIPIWQWDEKLQRGTDYTEIEHVRLYDERMAALRDVEAEAEGILNLLDLSSNDSLLEVGTGTGVFACAAARLCRKVIALDVSPVMLAYAKQRAEKAGIENIEFHDAGFLTYEHQDEPLAAVVSQHALHHLPDMWKLIALRRLAGIMSRAGSFYLSDVVFPDRAELDWPSYVERLLGKVPADQREEMACHLREEFSTFDWIMREILRRAGFRIESAEMEKDFLAHYRCRRL